MAQQRKHYDAVFKQKAVELANARGNVPEVAAELGIKPDLIHRWKREAKTYGLGSFPGNGRPKMPPQEAELADLRKKWREVLEFILEGRKDRMKQFYGSPR